MLVSLGKVHSPPRYRSYLGHIVTEPILTMNNVRNFYQHFPTSGRFNCLGSVMGAAACSPGSGQEIVHALLLRCSGLYGSRTGACIRARV